MSSWNNVIPRLEQKSSAPCFIAKDLGVKKKSNRTLWIDKELLTRPIYLLPICIYLMVPFVVNQELVSLFLFILPVILIPDTLFCYSASARLLQTLFSLAAAACDNLTQRTFFRICIIITVGSEKESFSWWRIRTDSPTQLRIRILNGSYANYLPKYKSKFIVRLEVDKVFFPAIERFQRQTCRKLHWWSVDLLANPRISNYPNAERMSLSATYSRTRNSAAIYPWRYDFDFC